MHSQAGRYSWLDGEAAQGGRWTLTDERRLAMEGGLHCDGDGVHRYVAAPCGGELLD